MRLAVCLSVCMPVVEVVGAPIERTDGWMDVYGSAAATATAVDGMWDARGDRDVSRKYIYLIKRVVFNCSNQVEANMYFECASAHPKFQLSLIALLSVRMFVSQVSTF